MAYIVKCPQCGEINIGSEFHCVKCETSLIGIPREQGESPLPEFINNHKPTENANNNIFNKMERKKIITGEISGSIYILTAVIVFIKSLLQQAETYKILGATLVFFVVGLIIYLTPADILYRIERNSGLFRPRLGLFETSKFERASTSYTIYGITLMFFALAMNVLNALLME